MSIHSPCLAPSRCLDQTDGVLVAKRLSSKERRKQILHCAIRVFARHSYRGATTKMISKEAGIAEALIYRYFGSKQNLFTEAVDHTGQRLVEGLDRCMSENSEDPLAALNATLHFYLQMLDRHENLAKMVFVTAAELDDPVVSETYLPHQERALEIVTKALETWQEEGKVRRDLPPRAAAWLFIGAYTLLALMKRSGGLSQVDPAAAVDLIRPILSEQAL